MARECQINPNGGPVIVKLSIDNALISGGNFKIYHFDTGIINEEFSLHTDASGSGFRQINMLPSNLVGQVLSWEVRTCTPIVTDSGILNIEIFQDDELCLTNPLASYKLMSVPNCSLNLAVPAKGGLHFITV